MREFLSPFWISAAFAAVGALAAIVGVILVLPPALATRKRLQRLQQTSAPLTSAAARMTEYLDSLQISFEQISELAGRSQIAFEMLRRNIETLRDVTKLFTGA